MKLFKSLLVAPATLGLLAPLSATANEINLNDISNYSKSTDRTELKLNSNSFDFVSTKDSQLISGGEGLVDTSVDSFSSTTTASFSSTFYVGSVDSGVDNGVTTFTYDFGIGLNTSFTGEDSLDVAIIGGNVDADLTSGAVDNYMGGDGTDDVLTLDGIAYTFPVGGITVTAGDGVGVDDLNVGACAYSAFTDLLSDCGTSNVGGQADSAVAASYDFGNGFTVAAGIGGAGFSDVVTTEDLTVADITQAQVLAMIETNGTGEDAVLIARLDSTGTGEASGAVINVGPLAATTVTGGDPLGFISDQDPSTVGLELAYTADTFGVSFAYTDDDAAGTEATYYSFQAAYTPDAPYSVSAGMEYDDADNSSYFVGVTTEAGVGSLSAGLSTQALAADHADNLQYELSYSYPVNDGMTITPGAFIAECAADDEFGVVVTTSFSF